MSGIVGGAGSKSGVIGETELDYEEGTWTPSYADVDGSINAGFYTKIGNCVHISGHLAASGGVSGQTFSGGKSGGGNSSAYTGSAELDLSLAFNQGSSTQWKMFNDGNADRQLEDGANCTINGFYFVD